jgi:hypothetical protein
MATLSKAVTKARQAEQKALRKVKAVEKNVEAKVTKMLAKDGAADKLAQRLDGMALEMKKDIDRLTEKWSKQFKALGDAIQSKAK